MHAFTYLKVLHVVASFHIVVHISAAGGPEGLDGVELVLLHEGGLATLNDRDRLAGMNLIRRNRVAIQVPDRLHLSKKTEKDDLFILRAF